MPQRGVEKSADQRKVKYFHSTQKAKKKLCVRFFIATIIRSYVSYPRASAALNIPLVCVIEGFEG